MKTIIPSSSISGKKQPGKNQQYVNSRSGGPAEQSRTKQESIKHQNPEYFKRQADRKNLDNANHRQKNVGNDPGRGVGQIGRDQGNFQMKQFSKGTMY